MSSGSRWGRRRRRDDEEPPREDAAPEPPGLADRGAGRDRVEGGLDELFRAGEGDGSDLEADALEARLSGEDEPDAAEQAREELAALLAEAEAQTEAAQGRSEPTPFPAAPEDEEPGLEIERDFRAPTALSREPIERPGAGTEQPAAVAEPVPARDPGESWDAIESLFTRRLETPEAPEEGAGLQLEWERPEMFTEPTQEEILRRISELGHGLELVEERLEELAKPLAEITEPGTRLAAAFKRLELIERAFEETRLQTERNTLKIGSALSALDSSMGELRAAMEEPMWEISERLTSAEIRLTELQASERLIDQVNTALAKDPFDLVSTRDIDEITEGITTKVKRLGGRVERLEAALDRGLSGLEEARRAALSAARELNKALERARRETGRAKPSESGSKPAPKKSAAKKSAAKKSPARKPASRRGSAES